MWHLRHCWSWLRRGRRPAAVGLGVLFLVLAWAAPAPAQGKRFPPDPVEELRQALRQDRDADTKKALDFRRDNLMRHADRITRLGDLGRALLLREWRNESLNPEVARIDQDVWTSLARRFKGDAQKALHSTDPERARAAATMVAQMSTAVETAGIRTAEVEQALAEFVPDLKNLASSDDPALRTSALHTLGRLGLAAQDVLPILRHALETDGVAQRRAAGDSLVTLIRIPAQSEKEGGIMLNAPAPQQKPSTTEPLPPPRPGAVPGGTRPAPNPPLTGADRPVSTGGNFQTHNRSLIDMSAKVVPVAELALRDPDPEVRRLGADALLQAAQNLTDSVLLPVTLDFPPGGRAVSQEERDRIVQYRDEVQQEWKLLTPLMDALKGAGADLGRAARDADPGVRLGALHAVEQVGYARDKLMRRWNTMPPEPKQVETPKEGDSSRDRDKDRDKDRNETSSLSGETVLAQLPRPLLPQEPAPQPNALPADPLRAALDEALAGLTDGLGARDARTRLASVEALEMLGELALPAVPALTRTLGDCNVFIRWATARTLGKMVPTEPDREVPAVLVAAVPALARLLCDEDLDLRIVVAQALGRYGPAGREAVPALTHTATSGDEEGRIAALDALGGIGTDAAPAIPAVIRDLADPDARLRLAAIRLLGRFGPTARDAAPALRALLNDPDPEVRRAASDALLSILPR